MSAQDTGIVKPKILRAIPNSGRKKTRTRWGWYPFIPLGDITLVAGPTDVGKSTVCIDIAAAFTTGKLNGYARGKPRNVLYIATEDSVEADITPKIEATGGDRSLFWNVEVENGWVNMPEDSAQLEDLIRQTNPIAVFIDPITSVVAGDRNRGDVVRPVLEGIRSIAEKHRLAVIGILHNRKGSGGSATEAVSGSTEWMNVSRCGLTIQEDVEDPGCFIFSINKNNRAPRDERINLRYRFQQRQIEYDDDDPEPGHAPKIQWLGETATSVDEMRADAASGVAGDLPDAVSLIERMLIDNGGSVTRADVVRAARAAGIASDVVTRAKQKLALTNAQGVNEPTWLSP